jgi:ABC-2 type transport system ATP-binding protein
VNAIEVHGLEKRYGAASYALRGLDLTLRGGEVLALLGPNGAGKSTTVEILAGFRRPSAGRVSVLGQDPSRAGHAFRERIGVVLQAAGIEPELRVEEAISSYAALYARPLPTDAVIEIVGLESKRQEKVAHLSGGQRRRLDLALGIVGDPELIFLDEPTTGFDPSARRQAWAAIDNLRSLGKSILLTTHYMDEAQHLSNRLAVIRAGRLVAEGTTAELAERIGSSAVVRFRSSAAPEAARLFADCRVRGRAAEIRTRDPVVVLHRLTACALAQRASLDELTVERPSLEDVYLALSEGDPGHA